MRRHHTMQPTIFILGVSGYIGGHTASLIARMCPNWRIVALVRNEKQATMLQTRWPTATAVVGCLDDHAILAEYCMLADVTLQLASSEHNAAAEVMIPAMSRAKRGLYVQMAGIGSLRNYPNGYGSPSHIVYHDNDTDVQLSSNFDPQSSESAITAAGIKHSVSTAILCPSLIYGVGNGLVRQRSTEISHLIEAILSRRRAFTVREAKNTMSNVHINDVASAIVLLVAQALCRNKISSPISSSYYFLEGATTTFDEITRTVVKLVQLHQALQFDTIERLSPGRAAQIHPWAPLLWGTNCRGRADKLKALGWEPKGPSLAETMQSMVDFEIERFAAQDENYLQTWRTDVEYHALAILPSEL